MNENMKPVGFICLNTKTGQYRGRTNWGEKSWKDKIEDAQVFRTEKSARVACGIAKDTPEHAEWKKVRARLWYERFPGRRFTYDNTDQEFIPVYPRL